MARALRWTIPFASHNGTSCVINIYAEGWTGGVTALTPNNPTSPGYPAANPFFYEEKKDKDILTPIRYSTGYIRLVEMESGGLDDLFPTDRLDRYVELLYGGTLAWKGYIQQKEFSNSFGGNPLMREFPIVSALGLADEIYFPVYDPPRAVDMKELMYTVIQQLNVTYSGVYMPMTSAGLDATISSLAICPFNPDHTFARYNTEAVFAPRSLAWFLEGLCNLYGYTLREVGDVLVFTAYNYGGQYMVYPYTPSGLSARSPVDAYGSTVQAIDDYFVYADSNGKLTRIESLKNVEYEFDGEISYEYEHDFDADTYADLQSRGNTSYAYLQPYAQSFRSSLLQTVADNTSYAPRTGMSVLVYNPYGGGLERNIVYGYSPDHGSTELFQQGFLGMRRGQHIMHLHMEWGYPADFNNDELANDIELSLVITVADQNSQQPLYYLKRNHTSFTWDTGGQQFSVKVDKASGDIKVDTDQAYGFIPIPPTPSPFQNVYVSVRSVSTSHLEQKSYYCFRLSMRTSYASELTLAVYPDLMKKNLTIGSNGDTKNISQNFSESVYAQDRVVSADYSISTITPVALATPQTRLEAKFRIRDSSHLVSHITYIVKHTYWLAGWRWRIIAVRFNPWDDEYTLVMHRSLSI